MTHENVSRHLSPFAIKGVMKAGDILAPGDDRLPAFSRTPVIREIDRLADFMTTPDRDGFKFLMFLFALLPRFAVRGILVAAENDHKFPAFLAAPLRLVQVGVKGVILTLYYSNLDPEKKIHQEIGWDAKCGPDPALETPPAIPAAEVFAKSRFAEAPLRKMTVAQRLEFITRLKIVILRRQDRILDEVQKATGKSRSDALISEIFGVLDHLAYLEKFSKKQLADRKAYTPPVLMGKQSQIWFEPLGTVLVISPWNYPFYQCIVPATSAFICGNAVVYKPSEFTPLAGLCEALLDEAGFDPSWIQIAYGDGQVGAALIDQRPEKIFFTGSTRTGKKIMEQASKYLIPVELELGGKDPMIVFEDANLTRAAAGAVWGAFTNTGQSCTSVERVFVHRSIFEPFKKAVVEQTRRIKQVTDRDGNADIGAMTTPEQVQIVNRHLEDARKRGAKFLTGGDFKPVNMPSAREGNARVHLMIPPTVLEDVTPEMEVYREETFGPVLPLIPFDDEDEVIRLANDTEYGLSASVWSKDLTRARRVARAIVTGNVSINNVMLTEGNHGLPFGGAKQSGFGRFKGEFGFYSFSNIKSVIVDKDSSKIEANWYPYTSTKFSLFGRLIQATFGSKGLSGLIKFALAGLGLESYSGKAAKLGRRPE